MANGVEQGPDFNILRQIVARAEQRLDALKDQLPRMAGGYKGGITRMYHREVEAAERRARGVPPPARC